MGNPEVGASLLCTDQCSEHFQVLGGEKLLNYESFCSFRGTSVASFGIDAINQYGCWCNFDERLTEGAGEPQNEYDSICKKFQLCLRCTSIDAKIGDYSCDPKTDVYQTDVDCSASNAGNVCGESLCSCDQDFKTR